MSEDQEKELLTTITEEVDTAIEEAKGTALPALETLVEDVYFSVPRSLQEQLEEITHTFHGELVHG